jgi:hypothetical protein
MQPQVEERVKTSSKLNQDKPLAFTFKDAQDCTEVQSSLKNQAMTVKTYLNS